MATDFSHHHEGHGSVADFGLVVGRSLEAGLGCGRVHGHQAPVLLVEGGGRLVGQLRKLGDLRLGHHMGRVKVVGRGAAVDGAEYVGHEES